MDSCETPNYFRNKIVLENKEFLKDKLLFEFGVCSGASLTNFYKTYEQNNIKSEFYGFDSWQGLPEEKLDPHTPWATGDFDTNGVRAAYLFETLGESADNVTFVDGFFADSLTEKLGKSFSKKQVGLVHMDCDTYSSTNTVQEWLVKHRLLVNGTIIIYDDWGSYRHARVNEYDNGQSRSFKEWCEKYNLIFEEIGQAIPDPEYHVIKAFRYLGCD